MSLAEDLFIAAALPLGLTFFEVTVSYNALPTNPGGSITVTAGISALRKHQPDLTPATQGPYQQRRFWVPTADIAAPKRADYITDSAGTNWTIKDVEAVIGGLTPCQTRIAQVDA